MGALYHRCRTESGFSHRLFINNKNSHSRSKITATIGWQISPIEVGCKIAVPKNLNLSLLPVDMTLNYIWDISLNCQTIKCENRFMQRRSRQKMKWKCELWKLAKKEFEKYSEIDTKLGPQSGPTYYQVYLICIV